MKNKKNINAKYFIKILGSIAFSFLLTSANASAASLYWYSANPEYSSNNWENTDYWWLDENHTTPAGAVPTGSDDAVILGGVLNTYAPHANIATWTEPASIDSSLNEGTSVILNSSNIETTSVTLTGNAVIRGRAIFNGIATNGTVTFEYRAQNTGTIEDAIFTEESVNKVGGTATGKVVFDQTAENYGTVQGDISFAQQSSNHSNADGTVTFSDESENSSAGTVTGSSATFNNTSKNLGSVNITGNSTFNNSASNSGGTVIGKAVFTDTYNVNTDFGTTGSKTINAIELTGSDVWTNQIEGTIESVSLANNSSNQGTITANEVTFSGLATNDGQVTANSISFYDGAANNGTITATTTTFYNGVNYGNITGDAVFINELPVYVSGTISGTKTRKFIEDTVTTLDFVTGGPWTVVADGVVVDYRGATYDNTTIFLAESEGSFVGNTNPVAVSSSNSNSSSGSRRLQIDVNNVHNITEDLNIVNSEETIKTLTELLNKLKEIEKKDFNEPFLRNLDLHSKNSDVKRLQQYLNSHGFIVSFDGVGAPGFEGDYFGVKTYIALKRFQASVKIESTGFFGFKTRAYINQNN